MRLLNTSSLGFQEFFDELTPDYAILSHRWSDQELSYADFLAGRKRDHAGYTKVLDACRLAQKHKHDWIWIDTICIDKTSSAELTEAINSMFGWYARSEICYAYLRDVPSKRFQDSEWFTRGWTLQELLAPEDVEFYDDSWSKLGTKAELAQTIHQVTRIPKWYLTRPDQIWHASIATRMSWAAKRTTTRGEDMAYCLLGIFNINMPLLYGERGSRAFFRLQLEISKVSADESIFAWTARTNEPCGMFASSPALFADSGNVRYLHLAPEDRAPWEYTNKGLQLSLTSPMNARASFSMGNSLLDSVKYGDPHKIMTLGCFLGDAEIDMRDAKAVKAGTKGKIFCVELQRVGAGWKRINAHKVQLAKEFERYSTTFTGGVMQKVYYVVQ